MKPQSSLNWLVPVVILLTLAAAAVGLFFRGGDGPFEFTTTRGQAVQINGQGIYAFDSVMKAAIFQGTDVVILFVEVPLLIFAYVLYRRGSLRGAFLLCGALSAILYNASSLAFGAAYNQIFLVYVALFSASLFAFVLALMSIDLQALPGRVAARMPNNGIAWFLFAAGIILFMVWMMDIVPALLAGRAVAGLASYTTEVTYGFDLGIIVPFAILGWALLRQRRPMGYLIAAPMLYSCLMIGIIVSFQTVYMTLVGISLSPVEFAIKVGSFLVLGLVSGGFTFAFFRNISAAPVKAGSRQNRLGAAAARR